MRFLFFIVFGACLSVPLPIQAQDPKTAAKPFCEGGGFSLSLSSDGKRLAIGGGRSFPYNGWAIWAFPTGERLFSAPFYGAWGLAFSPDGKLLAVGGNYNWLKLINAKTGTLYWELTKGDKELTNLGHLGPIDRVGFTPGSQFLISSSGSDGTLRLWDLQQKGPHAIFCFTSTKAIDNEWKIYLTDRREKGGDTPLAKLKTFVVYPEPIDMLYDFAVSPDGKLVAVALGTSAGKLIELATGKVVQTIQTEQLANCSVCFSKDGKILAIGGGRTKNNSDKCTIEIWDPINGKRITTLIGHTFTVSRLAISPDNRILISGGVKDGVRLWDLETGKQKYAFYQNQETRVAGVAFMPDGKTFLTLGDLKDEPVRFWDTATGKEVSPVKGAPAGKAP